MLTTYAIANYDPTKLITLRNAFSRDLSRRFRELQNIIRYAIVHDDIFGLNPTNYAKLQSPGTQAFKYLSVQEKLVAFMDWVQQQVNKGILAPEAGRQLTEALDVAWSNVYVLSAYQRGVQRARTELLRANYAVPTIDASGGIGMITSNPLHSEKIKLLYTQVYNELKGVTDAMNQQISRILTQSMIEGKNADQIARRLIRVIGGPALELTDTLGRFIPAMRRAQMIARTELTRSFANAQLQEFSNWGVRGVRIKVEFATAGDDRVCPICSDFEGREFTLEAAAGLIPRHVNCRCCFLPVLKSTRKVA
jgi:SPP1 gp7 family putative phage head morphogenesis protein